MSKIDFEIADELEFEDGDCCVIIKRNGTIGRVVMPDINQDIIKTFDNPIKSTGHIRILYGNLAINGSVAKITGKEGLKFKGLAKVFEGEFQANDGIKNIDEGISFTYLF